MSQSQNEGVNNGEERLVEEEEEEEDFEAAYSRAQKEFTREAITNFFLLFLYFLMLCISFIISYSSEVT